jgi:hypothetical protein
LFKAREWWRVTCGEEEEFDRGCMAVANIDNHPNGEGALPPNTRTCDPGRGFPARRGVPKGDSRRGEHGHHRCARWPGPESSCDFAASVRAATVVVNVQPRRAVRSGRIGGVRSNIGGR